MRHRVPLPIKDGDDIVSFAGSYRFLSNFFPAPVMFEDHEYPTVEHAFQAAKTTSEKERRAIRSQSTPGRAKAHGRKVELREDWERVKLDIMYQLVRFKFETNPELCAKLLATKGQLVEGNYWHDTFWGVCEGEGHNHLGKILMRVRDELSDMSEEG